MPPTGSDRSSASAAQQQDYFAGEVGSPLAPTEAQGAGQETKADPWGFLRILDEEGNIRPLAELEAEIIRRALMHHNYRMSDIARKLGIGRSTLYRKLKEYDLEDKDPDETERNARAS